ncbi:MAG: rhodanese-like domain-containing protein [Rhodocyclaceae bacterium]|nr:rhodanese-like domain-containing protein [Rhodocyclaceae bacterium]
MKPQAGALFYTSGLLKCGSTPTGFARRGFARKDGRVQTVTLADFLQQNWFWAALAVGSGVFLLFDMLRARADTSLLTPTQATLLINREEPLVIDLRTQGEFDKGRLNDARNIAQADLSARLSDLQNYKTRPILLYCATGMRSAASVKLMREAGFEKVFHLQGGLMEWEKANLPVTRKRTKK